MIFNCEFTTFLKVYFISIVYLKLQLAVSYPMHRGKHTYKRITRSSTNFYLRESSNALRWKISTENPDLLSLTQDKSADLEDDYSHFWSAWHASQPSTTKISPGTVVTVVVTNEANKVTSSVSTADMSFVTTTDEVLRYPNGTKNVDEDTPHSFILNRTTANELFTNRETRSRSTSTDMPFVSKINEHLIIKGTKSYHFTRTPLRQARNTIRIGNEIFDKHYVTAIIYPNPTDHDLFLGSYYNQKWVNNFFHHIKNFGSTWSTILIDHFPNPAVTKGVGVCTWLIYYSYQPNVTKGVRLHRHFYVLKNLTRITTNSSIATTTTTATATTTSTTTRTTTPTTTRTTTMTTTTEMLLNVTISPNITTTLLTSLTPTTSRKNRLSIHTTDRPRLGVPGGQQSMNGANGEGKNGGLQTTKRAMIGSRGAGAATEQSWLQKYAPYITALIAAATILGGVYCALKAYKRSRPQRGNVPIQWRQVGTLKAIYAYPVKSCGPVVMTNAECTFLGLRDNWTRDRFLMVVNKNNHHVSARSFPQMLAVQPSVKGYILTLRYKNMEPLHIDLAQVKTQSIAEKVYVCDVSVPVKDCGAEASDWFSRLLDPQRKCKYRLVLYASENSRHLTASKQKLYLFTKYDSGALSNESAFNLINEASVNDLNSRLKGSQVSPRNFRPNFVVSGAEAFDEDKWKFVKIRETVFTITKPCYRCIIIAIDPDTTVRIPNHEPLEVLRSYRQSEVTETHQLLSVGPRMGVQLARRSEPGVRAAVGVNDPVFVSNPSRCWCKQNCEENVNRKNLSKAGNNEDDRDSETRMNFNSTNMNQVGNKKFKEAGTTQLGSYSSSNRSHSTNRNQENKKFKEAGTTHVSSNRGQAGAAYGAEDPCSSCRPRSGKKVE